MMFPKRFVVLLRLHVRFGPRQIRAKEEHELSYGHSM